MHTRGPLTESEYQELTFYPYYYRYGVSTNIRYIYIMCVRVCVYILWFSVLDGVLKHPGSLFSCLTEQVFDDSYSSSTVYYFCFRPGKTLIPDTATYPVCEYFDRDGPS